MAVGGDFIILGGAEIAYASTAPLVLGGDFVNESTNAEIFDWLGGAICLGACGPLASGPSTNHAFEAAGRDIGAEPAGYGLNYAIGKLTVSGGARHVGLGRVGHGGRCYTPKASAAVTLKAGTLRSAAASSASETGSGQLRGPAWASMWPWRPESDSRPTRPCRRAAAGRWSGSGSGAGPTRPTEGRRPSGGLP